MDIEALAQEINRRATKWQIGSLQDIRKQIHGLSRRPTKDIFSPQSTFTDFAFHHGGRRELQFNIGLDTHRVEPEVRHGVPFSLQESQTLPDISVLIPKVGRFNEFIDVHDEEYREMRMWRWHEGEAGDDYFPTLISPEQIDSGAFIFLGKQQPVNSVDVEVILEDFDKLLPLYKYVEDPQAEGTFPELLLQDDGFDFRPGHESRQRRTTATRSAKQVDVSLRHGELQDRLVRELQRRYGEDVVGSETRHGRGGRIDVVLKVGDRFRFYEIKTGRSARSCIRAALGQILEYGLWPGGPTVEELVIVGEPRLDEETGEYMCRLRDDYGLPLRYKSVELSSS